MPQAYAGWLLDTLHSIGNWTWFYLDEITFCLFPWDCFSLMGIGLFFLLTIFGAMLKQNHSYIEHSDDLVSGIFPKKILFSRRMLQDLFLSFTILLMFGVFMHFQIPVSAQGIGLKVIHGLADIFSIRINPVELKTHGHLVDLSYALFLFLFMEFGHWVYHYLSHKIPFLWEFHKVHHAPSTMSPATDYRLHPVDYTLILFSQGFLVGIATLIWNISFGFNSIGQDSQFVMMCFLVFLYLPATLHHSFRWWAWGKFEWVILSPACHTLHHSVDPKHYNSNYGLRLTIFDHLFGTYLKPGRTPPENFKLGLADEGYDWDKASFWALMVDPVKKSVGTIFRKSDSIDK